MKEENNSPLTASYLTLIRHNSKGIHVRAAKLHTNKDLIVELLNRGSTLMKDLTN